MLVVFVLCWEAVLASSITHCNECTTHTHPPQYTKHEKSGVSDTTFPQLINYFAIASFFDAVSTVSGRAICR
jgi:hypothetical protein